MRSKSIAALVSIVLLVLAAGQSWGQDSRGDGVMGTDGESRQAPDPLSADPPQAVVECSGWHALCSFAADCRVDGDIANCACWKVDEPHFVTTGGIQDRALKRQTREACTTAHPCAADEAPVCDAIRHGQYKVDGIKYSWVSTYSYRGWCGLWDPVACLKAGGAPSLWASCMGAPCTESPSPKDPDRPLTCQCLTRNSSYVGTKGSCLADRKQAVMSTIPLSSWDFQANTFTFEMPSYGYVQGACATLQSD